MDAGLAAPQHKQALAASSRVLMLRLWREHLRHYRARLVSLLALTAVMSGATALYPVVIQRAFALFTAKDPRILYQVPLIVIAVTGLKAVAQYFQNYEVHRLVLLVIRDLQQRLFAHLTMADLEQVEREAPAQLTARFTTDAVAMRESLVRSINGLADALTVIGLIASMFYLDWVMSLIAAALYPLAAVPIERIGRRIRHASGSMQALMGETVAFLHESFAQARTVRAYRLEAKELAQAESAFTNLYRALLRMTRGRVRVEPVLEVLGGAAVAAVIGFAGWRVATGTESVGNFTGFVAALLIAARPLRALGSFNAALQEGLAGLARIFHLLDEPPRVVDPPAPRPMPEGGGRVVFDHVHFVYPDGRVGLNGLSFVAEPGRMLAIVGPSGAGKSTALALIPRLQDVASGAVRIDGVDVRELRLADLREAIAYVGQDAALFDDTIAANIRLGRADASEAEMIAAARAAAAEAFIAALPDGFATRVGPGGSFLSGGERQRVLLARAFLRDPRILLLDEATSALDAESEAAVQKALAQLRRGRTTIVVAHRLATVRDADWVVVMVDGRVAEQGTHAELMTRNGLFARLVRTQALVH
jgi:subfamily B ATP-binding cassette protein MsbA